MRLNIGCGDHYAAGWVNIDRVCGPSVHPDAVAHSAHLPLADGCAGWVYCGHVLEHLRLEDEVPETLREIRRVLAPAGRLCVVGPDETRAMANPRWHDYLPGIREGGDRWAGDIHQWVATGPKTLEAMLPVFPHAREVELADVAGDWPLVSDIGWQFAIVA